MSGNFYRKRAADLMRKVDQADDPGARAALVCQAAHWHALATHLEACEPPSPEPALRPAL
jgi:hypothetical protein